MGCGGSRAIRPDEFLQPQTKDAANLCEPSNERMLLAFAAGQTSSPLSKVLLGHTDPKQIALTVHKFATGMGSDVVQNPDGEMQVGSAPVAPWSSPEPFLTLTGTAAPAPKAPVLRLEVHTADGTPIGLLLTKCKRNALNVPAQMHIYSVRPRHAGQPAAVELSFSEKSGAVQFLPTKTPLRMGDGAALYAWARVQDLQNLRAKLLVFMADASGKCSVADAKSASFVVRATAIAGKTLHTRRAARAARATRGA